MLTINYTVPLQDRENVHAHIKSMRTQLQHVVVPKGVIREYKPAGVIIEQGENLPLLCTGEVRYITES